MLTTAPDNRLYVVVGVLRDENQQLLVQRRMPGKPCAGQWEFPGGKLEAGESPQQALTRELKEELDIDISNPRPLTQLGFDYDHARVWLDVYLVTEFCGNPRGAEMQSVTWLDKQSIRQLDVLPAVYPILDTL